MLTPEFCWGQATVCEHMAAESRDRERRLEWLRMANEWRVTAAPSRDNAEHRPESPPAAD